MTERGKEREITSKSYVEDNKWKNVFRLIENVKRIGLFEKVNSEGMIGEIRINRRRMEI